MQQEFNHEALEGHEEDLHLRVLRALRGAIIERIDIGITYTRTRHLVALAPAVV